MTNAHTAVVEHDNLGDTLSGLLPDYTLSIDGQSSVSSDPMGCIEHAYTYHNITPDKVTYGPKFMKRFTVKQIASAVADIQKRIKSGALKYETPEERKERYEQGRRDRVARIAARNALKAG